MFCNNGVTNKMFSYITARICVYICNDISEFRIVIICSSESEETSHVVSKLLQFKRDYAILQKDKELVGYLKHHFTNNDATSAAAIDPEK